MRPFARVAIGLSIFSAVRVFVLIGRNLYGCTYPIGSIVFERGFQLSNSSFSAYENTCGYRSRTRTKGCPFPQRDGSSGDYVLEHIPSACQFEYDDKFYGK
jgi:hypothetical protein